MALFVVNTAFAFSILWFVVLMTSSLVGALVYLWSGAAVPTFRSHPPHHAANVPAPHGAGGSHSAGADDTQFPSAS